MQDFQRRLRERMMYKDLGKQMFQMRDVSKYYLYFCTQGFRNLKN